MSFQRFYHRTWKVLTRVMDLSDAMRYDAKTSAKCEQTMVAMARYLNSGQVGVRLKRSDSKNRADERTC